MKIKTVTVLGANGTMGSNVSAIFAAFGHAKVYMVCRDLKAGEEARERACHSVRAESLKEQMIPVTYESLEQVIPESDLVFESTAEDWEVKVQVTKQVVQAADADRNRHTVFCTGSSGLSIAGLAGLYPEELRPNYIGMHLFNPPYQMTLCELIPSRYTDRELLGRIKSYCRDTLLRTVVEGKDSPAFLGNRIGFRFMNEALLAARNYQYNGGIDYIDAILGPFTGRTMPPCRTADFVGLDVHQAIVDNLYENTHDFAHEDFQFPGYVGKLIERGALGRKSGQGLYKTEVHDSGVKVYQVYDIASDSYRNVMNYRFPFAEGMVSCMKRGEYTKAFSILIENRSVEADLCLRFLLTYILYSISAGEEAGSGIHSADAVMAAGFHWCPPLALAGALSEAGDLRRLYDERMGETRLDKGRRESLLGKLKQSAYDYRVFMKAKR